MALQGKTKALFLVTMVLQLIIEGLSTNTKALQVSTKALSFSISTSTSLGDSVTSPEDSVISYSAEYLVTEWILNLRSSLKVAIGKIGTSINISDY